MEQEIKNLIENFDSWVKEIKKEISDLQDLKSCTVENVNNIQHSYELILELRNQIEELKLEINKMKLIQIIQFNSEELEE